MDEWTRRYSIVRACLCNFIKHLPERGGVFLMLDDVGEVWLVGFMTSQDLYYVNVRCKTT